MKELHLSYFCCFLKKLENLWRQVYDLLTFQTQPLSQEPQFSTNSGIKWASGMWEWWKSKQLRSKVEVAFLPENVEITPGQPKKRVEWVWQWTLGTGQNYKVKMIILGSKTKWYSDPSSLIGGKGVLLLELKWSVLLLANPMGNCSARSWNRKSM